MKNNESKCILTSRAVRAFCVLNLNYSIGQSKHYAWIILVTESATQNKIVQQSLFYLSNLSIHSECCDSQNSELRMLRMAIVTTPTLRIVNKASFHFVHFINFIYYNFQETNTRRRKERKKEKATNTSGYENSFLNAGILALWHRQIGNNSRHVSNRNNECATYRTMQV